MERVYVIGEKGAMQMEHKYLPSKGPAQVGEMHSKLIVNEKVAWDGIQEEWPFAWQMKEFVTCLSEGRPPIADGRDVRNVIPIIEAAEVASERHEVIAL